MKKRDIALPLIELLSETTPITKNPIASMPIIIFFIME